MERIFALIVAAVFVVAGAFKLGSPEMFAGDIERYALVPGSVSQFLAYSLPPLEILTGVALLWPRFRLAGWFWAAALFAMFAFAVGAAKIRGLDISCGCFGSDLRLTWMHFAVNALLFGSCLRLFFKTFEA